ncbi:hypothetical protein HPB50_002875 [Hyalomma asiaticum]|uniref:Uncharacterized protein n=1 Tax=Hyalomma asiaticum TaxID=266040 RepID=A0ACB7SB70_HYAAI|nr:hypothetical protein HPB50_002875 [Hyalomma asiaticum]
MHGGDNRGATMQCVGGDARPPARCRCVLRVSEAMDAKKKAGPTLDLEPRQRRTYGASRNKCATPSPPPENLRSCCLDESKQATGSACPRWRVTDVARAVQNGPTVADYAITTLRDTHSSPVSSAFMKTRLLAARPIRPAEVARIYVRDGGASRKDHFLAFCGTARCDEKTKTARRCNAPAALRLSHLFFEFMGVVTASFLYRANGELHCKKLN